MDVPELSATKPPVALRLLRAPALLLPDGERPLSDNDAALLMLAIRRGPAERDWVARLLWPDSTRVAALASLRQRDSRLGKAAGRVLLTKNGKLALMAGIAHDLGDPKPRLAHDALELGAPLLEGFDFSRRGALAEVVDAERAAWRQAVLDTIEELALTHETEARIDDALRYARRWVREEPCGEAAARLLMRLHHRRGDRALALAVFEQLKQRLLDELGETPGDATVALAQQVAAAAVPAAPALRELPEALRHPPLTVGRDGVVAEACRRLAQGRVVLITGAAGVGKSRVFDDVVQRLAEPVVLRLDAEDAAVPLAPVRRLARLLVPDGASMLPTSALFDRLVAALAQAPQAQTRRVVAIEDLHHADAESAALLARLLALRLPATWLLTSREHTLPASLLRWLDACDGDEPQFRLGALAVGEIAEFVAAVHPQAVDAQAWAAHLEVHCGGHALTLLQVLRTLHDQGLLGAQVPACLPVPREAMQRVARLLDQCEPRAQQLAFASALCSSQFSVELATRLLGCSVTELTVPWRRLQTMGVLRGGGYTHDLVRQAVLDALPAELAPGMHREVAEALRDAGAPAARRVYHWKAAQRWQEAAQDLWQAYGDAMASGLRHEARLMLSDAAACWTRAGDAAATFDARARCASMTLALLSADAAAQEIQALAPTVASERQHCQLLVLQAQLLAERHDAAALPTAKQALGLAEALGDERLQALAGLRLAMAEYAVGHAEAAVQGMRHPLQRLPALDCYEQQDLHDGHALALVACGRRRQAVQVWLDELECARAQQDLSRTAELASNAAVQLGYLCDSERALALAEEAMAIDQRVGAESGFAAVNVYSAAALCTDCGRYARAVELGERAVAALRGTGLLHHLVGAENTLAGTFILLGRKDLAAQLLAAVPEATPLHARAMRVAAQARLARAGGRPWLHAMQQAREMLEGSGLLASRYAYWRIELELAKGAEAPVRAERAAACAAWAEPQQHLALARHAAMVHTAALLDDGQRELAALQADDLYERCCARWGAFDFYLPELWWTLVRAWDANGQRARADALAQHASGWISQCARVQMPELFRASFLRDNEVNRLLLARAASTAKEWAQRTDRSARTPALASRTRVGGERSERS